MQFESLHNHTNYSDGLMALPELMHELRSSGCTIAAITEHDSLPNDAMLEYLFAHKDEGIDWIIGTELTVELPEECKGLHAHLIGLFVDPRNEEMRAHATSLHAQREERMRMLVSHAQSLGFTVTAEEVLAHAHGDALGMPHVANVIALHPENAAVLHKLEAKVRAQRGENENAEYVCAQMDMQGDRGKPYVLFLSRRSYFPPPHIDIKLPTLREGTEMIHRAGGVSFLAHYFAYSKYVTLPQVQSFITNGAMDGAEVVYQLFSDNDAPDEHLERERIELLHAVETVNGMKAGGADIHAVRDITQFLANPDLAHATLGMTDAIVKSGKVNIAHSSL